MKQSLESHLAGFGPLQAYVPPSSCFTTRSIEVTHSTGNRFVVAHVGPPSSSLDPHQAVAYTRMFVAAPKMLAALRIALAFCEVCNDPQAGEIAATIREAINSATIRNELLED